MKFKDRSDAGRQLAASLKAHRGWSDVLVLALPPGGVPVATEIARALDVPLDVLLTRNLGVPGRDALAMGTITSGGTCVLNDEVVKYLGISKETINTVSKHEQRELERRERLYRDHRPAPDIRSKTVVLVDDGLATGAMMEAALAVLWKQYPAHLIVAIPVIARTTWETIERLSDEIITLGAQSPSSSLPDGIWYEDFRQPTDIEASNILSDLHNHSLPHCNFSFAEFFSASAKISDEKVKKPCE